MPLAQLSTCDTLPHSRVSITKATNLGTGYQPVSKVIPTLVSIVVHGVLRVRGVTLMANDSRYSRQAALLHRRHFRRLVSAIRV